MWVAVAAPFAALALVLVFSGGRGFLFQERYAGGDVTSGRSDTWKQVGRDWVHGNIAQKMFGDTGTVRAVVHRADDGHQPGEKPLDLTTDNAAVGALRRGGVLGELAFLLGLGLLLTHAWRGARADGTWRGARADGTWRGRGSAGARRAPPAWLTVTAVGSLPTIATADWLLGGTGGTLWILLVAGEAWLVLRPAFVEKPEPDPVLAPSQA
jgi:hypothetical protein